MDRLTNVYRYGILLALSLLAANCGHGNSTAPTTATPSGRTAYTRNGLHVVVESSRANAPAVVLVSAPDAETGLSDPLYGDVAKRAELAGWTAVSIDCLDNGAFSEWINRINRHEDFPALYAAAVQEIISDLLQRQVISADRLTLYGISRSAFLAVHVAARDARFRYVLALMPVTELGNLSEFEAMKNDPYLQRLSSLNVAGDFAGRNVLVMIGHADDRVGTPSAEALAQRLTSGGAQADLIVTQDESHNSTIALYDTAFAWWQTRVHP